MGEAAAVRVVARIRPDSTSSASTIRSFSPLSVRFKTGEEFKFSHVLGPESTQEETYGVVGGGLISEALLGFNTTIIAYGQTSSGKTYTMMGGESEESFGVIPKLGAELFAQLDEIAGQRDRLISVKVSFVEIYRERLRDLLNAFPRTKTELKIREGDSKKVIVEGLTEEFVSSREELLLLMQRGNAARSVAATRMNEDSSRSHSVFTMKLVQQYGTNDVVVESKIQLVDLAGSEQVKRTGAQGDRLEEAKSINLSLSCLGNVVSSLSENSKFVPYRDSKLTRILQDSLGGTAKTCLICTVSPHSANEAETLSTLRFGTRAQKVQNLVVRNIRRSQDELERLLAAAEEKIHSLQSQQSFIAPDGPNEELALRVEDLELALETSTSKLDSMSTKLETSERERKRLELMLSESTHRERALQIDLNFATQQISENLKQTHDVENSRAYPQDVAMLTGKCLKFQILLKESQEEVEMLKQSKVDQVWVYLLETQSRLKKSERDKEALESEVAVLAGQVKNKQEHVDEMKREHASVKTTLQGEVSEMVTKLGDTREELKRYKQLVDVPSLSSRFHKDGGSFQSTLSASHPEEASFVSIEEDY